MDQENRDLLIRLDTKVDHISHQLQGGTVKMNDHETRLRKLEKFMWSLPPVSAALTAIIVELLRG